MPENGYAFGWHVLPKALKIAGRIPQNARTVLEMSQTLVTGAAEEPSDALPATRTPSPLHRYRAAVVIVVNDEALALFSWIRAAANGTLTVLLIQ
jgi:hypothetical protein